jgi:hypothetical protein
MDGLPIVPGPTLAAMLLLVLVVVLIVLVVACTIRCWDPLPTELPIRRLGLFISFGFLGMIFGEGDRPLIVGVLLLMTPRRLLLLMEPLPTLRTAGGWELEVSTDRLSIWIGIMLSVFVMAEMSSYELV